MQEKMKKGILREKRPGIFVVHPEGDEYYEKAREAGGKEILYLNERVTKEQFKELMKKGMKSIPATVLDPKYNRSMVYYFEV